jgi:DNA-binding CsgD family transcriptional regulator
MSHFRFCVFLVFFALISQLSNAQHRMVGLPEIRNFKRTDYKGATQNWDIDQDKNGNLYFANNNGLFQFDGSSWSKYILPGNSIRSLKVDSNGLVYVGGYNEFGYFKSNEKGKLIYYSLVKGIKDNLKKQFDFIWKIHIYKDEVIFQSFSRFFIYKKGNLTIVEAPTKFQFSFLVRDQIYFQDKSQGLLIYNNETLTVVTGTTLFNSTEIWGMFALSPNQIIIATIDKGLFEYKDGKINAWNTPANDYVKKNSSLGGLVFKNDLLALNSVLDGIIVCDKFGIIVQHINQKKGLQNNTILTSFLDRDNSLWLGLDNGITHLNISAPLTFLGPSYNISTVYNSVLFHNKLYVATNQGLFYHQLNDNFKDETFSLVNGTNGQAWNIQVIDDKLLCSHNQGALAISKDQSIINLDPKGYWGFKSIPSTKNKIIGSNYNGFALFDSSEKGLRYLCKLEGFNKSSNFFEIENNHLWVLKDGIVYKLRLNEDQTKIVLVHQFKELSQKNRTITSMQHYDKNIYFQSNNHFYRFSYDQNNFFEDKKMSNLFRDIPDIDFFSEDVEGNIWYVYNESLGVLLKKKDGKFQNNLNQFSALKGNLVKNYLSVNTINKDQIYIGLTDGLAHYDLDRVSKKQSKPNAFIRSFSNPVDTIIMGNGVAKTKVMVIPYRFNKVKFTFSAPIFESPENVLFSCKLEGFDDQWSSWSSNPMKEYTNLKEGDYEMNLKVKNNFGVQSEAVKFNFSITPPWYRHYLAYLLYLVIIGCCIYLIRLIVKAKIRKNKYFEKVEQRRIYLEKETQIRQEQYNLEKEIEKLKSDKLKLKILAKDKELVNNSLQVAKKNKILTGIIIKLKDIDVNNFDKDVRFQIEKLNKSISKEVNADNSWKDLEKHIKNVHFDFLKRLKEKCPTISSREMDLSTYLLMNMTTKEISEIMNISTGGVELARYRLRKKLGLTKKENLTGFFMSI